MANIYEEDAGKVGLTFEKYAEGKAVERLTLTTYESELYVSVNPAVMGKQMKASADWYKVTSFDELLENIQTVLGDANTTMTSIEAVKTAADAVLAELRTQKEQAISGIKNDGAQAVEQIAADAAAEQKKMQDALAAFGSDVTNINKAEQERISEEQKRKDAETTRVNAEKQRDAAETTRNSAEKSREAAEAQRIKTDEVRKEDWAHKQTEITSAAKIANDAAATALKAKGEAEEATKAASSAAATAATAATNANSAATKANEEAAKVAPAIEKMQQDYTAAEAQRNTKYSTAEASRTSDYNTKEAARQKAASDQRSEEAATAAAQRAAETATFEEKEATRDAANQAALNAAESLGQLTQKVTEHDAAITKLNELFGEGVEGYVCISGASDPNMNYREFKHTAGAESVFDCIKPCLVGNNFTGRVGEILHVLDPTNWYKTEDGREVKLDATDGEVMVCNTRTIYMINGHVTVGNVEYDVFLRSYEPFEWHGHAAEKVDPMGWSPSYVVSHKDDDNVTRFHSCYNMEYNGSYSAQQGIVGAFVQTQQEDGSVTEVYDEQAALFGSAAGLSTTGVTLYGGEQYAMNLNEDVTKTYPYYNRTAQCEEVMFGNILSEGGTFDAHKSALMGSGFCSNDIASSEAHWGESNADARNGFRYVKSNGAWGYYGLNSNANFGYGASDDNLYKACMLNSWRTPWRCLEQQRVMMYAIEHNVPELTWFAFEGNRYKWRHVDGFAGPSQGAMTCVVWKHFASKLVSNCVEPGTTNDVSGNRCEFLICSAMYRGVITDVSPSWWTSGLIFTEDENGQYEAYMQRDQKQLIKSENGDKNVDDMFDFEQQYPHVGSYDYGSGYRKTFSDKAIMLPANKETQAGASLHTYVGGYNYFTGPKAGAGKKSGRGFRRGGYAANTSLSPFCVGAYSAPSNAGSLLAFGTCVTLTKTERSV